MNTKILILFSLFVLGIAEECREDTATSCVDNLLTALLGPESEICGELRKVNDCLKSAVETCLGDDRGTDVDEGLKQLDDLLHQNCPEETSGDDKCLENNKEYIMECMGVGARETVRLLGMGSNVDSNSIKCSAYSLISHCVLERTEEKCGKEIRDSLKEELDDPPQEIADACEAAEVVEFTDVQPLLLDKK